MTRARPLQAVAATLEIVPAPLRVNMRPPGGLDDPRRHLRPAPQTPRRRRLLQRRRQVGQLCLPQQGLPAAVAPPPIAKRCRTIRVVARDQLVDPAHGITRRIGTLGNILAGRQKPHDVKMAPRNRIARAPIARIQFLGTQMPEQSVPFHHDTPYLVIPTTVNHKIPESIKRIRYHSCWDGHCATIAGNRVEPSGESRFNREFQRGFHLG